VEISDEALCRRVAEHDEAAFDVLVERYQRRAYRLAWSILRDGEEARDVAQEAFLRLYQSAGTFGGRARFSTWFFRILVNLCLEHRRRARGWRRLLVADTTDTDTSLVERQPAPSADPVESITRERTMTELWAAVERLSPQQRAAVLLQVQEDLSTSEIAEVLGCSEATVRVHLHRAVAALRGTLVKR
jgi:RNA polymerase sigma-70 factor (ECF subfamily)